MKFSLDKEKAVELAKKLDINVKFNDSKPGVTITSKTGYKDFDFDDFFPELKQGENFITKDKDVFLTETSIKKTKRVIICFEQSTTISNSKKLTGAA